MHDRSSCGSVVQLFRLTQNLGLFSQNLLQYSEFCGTLYISKFYDQIKGNKNGAVRGANGSNCSPEAATVETTLAEAKALGTTVDEEAAPLNGAGEKGKADVVVVTSKGSKGANNGGTSTKVCLYAG